MNEIIFHFLNSFALQNIWLDTFIIFLAEYFAIILVVLFVLFYIFKFLYPTMEPNGKLNPQPSEVFKIIYITLLSSILVWIVSQIINYFYFSPRPFVALDNINVLFEHGGNDSFPSGHTTFLFTLAFMTHLYGKRLIILLSLGALLVGIARVVAGVHWPTDILAGIILAFVGVSIIKFTIPYFSNK